MIGTAFVGMVFAQSMDAYALRAVPPHLYLLFFPKERMLRMVGDFQELLWPIYLAKSPVSYLAYRNQELLAYPCN